jgi:hypothetical protein
LAPRDGLDIVARRIIPMPISGIELWLSSRLPMKAELTGFIIYSLTGLFTGISSTSAYTTVSNDVYERIREKVAVA